MSFESETEERLKDVEEFVKLFHQTTMQEAVQTHRDSASFMALYAIVCEIACHLGVSAEAFLRHYEIRRHYFYDYYIAKIAKTSPKVAEAVDQRSPNSAPPHSSFPPLFDPPPQGKT